MKSQFEKWQAGEFPAGNFGSFQTLIFRAYALADSVNKRKLEVAYPEWFIVCDNENCETRKSAALL